jgi:RNA polymerase sigma factor (sigma-70 family)
MTTIRAGVLYRHLRGLTALESSGQQDDQLLLERFVTGRDEAAFEALLRRHGPMVLGVCRRLLHDPHAAEDAFQATFLILAHKASVVGRRGSVGGFLYRVAYNTALKARAGAELRRRHERQAGERPCPDPLAELTGRELLAVLDEEMQGLPERYRAPLVLCYLEGKTRDEAARQLGWSLTTFKRRLVQARACLRRRLERRGLALPAALLPAGLATVKVPAALSAAVAQAARLTGAGQATPVPPHVAALMTGALNAGRLKLAALAVLLATLIGAGLVVCAAPVLAPSGPQGGSTAAPPAEAKATLEGERMTVTGRVLAPDGKPVAGAAVALVGQLRRPLRPGETAADLVQMLAEGKAEAAGRYRLRAPRPSSARYRDVVAVAAAPGHALAFAKLSPDAERAAADLRLLPEQVLRGRLVDLQGVPVAGAVVSVSRVGSLNDGEAPTLTLAGLPGASALWPRPATTDAKGRFVLRGINRDREAALVCKGKDFAQQYFQVYPVGKPLPEQKTLGLDVGGYLHEHSSGPDAKGQAEEPTFTLAPTQVLEGRVVYADTGKPAAGARVQGVPTDKDGRFRLLLGQVKALTAVVEAPADEPYLTTFHRVVWPRGAVKQEVEVRLPRGVLVRGKVTEAGSGKAVAGASVQFWPRQKDNPNLLPRVITGWQAIVLTKDDGSFAMAVLPGPGHLLIQGPTPDYVHQEIGHSTLYSGEPGGSRHYPDAVVKLDLLARGEPKELAVTLRRGVTVRGRLLGPDGKPVARAVMLHRLHITRDLGWHFAAEARDGVFAVHGLDPDGTVPVFFLAAEHGAGVVATLSGKQAGQEVTVRLVPCGKATARYLDDKGKPVAGLQAAPEIVITPADGRGKLSADGGSLTNLDRHNYWDKVKTDAAGRVTFPALIPGATYRIEEWSAEGQRRVLKEFTVKPGKTVDLGDITLTRPE